MKPRPNSWVSCPRQFLDQPGAIGGAVLSALLFLNDLPADLPVRLDHGGVDGLQCPVAGRLQDGADAGQAFGSGCGRRR